MLFNFYINLFNITILLLIKYKRICIILFNYQLNLDAIIFFYFIIFIIFTYLIFLVNIRLISIISLILLLLNLNILYLYYPYYIHTNDNNIIYTNSYIKIYENYSLDEKIDYCLQILKNNHFDKKFHLMNVEKIINICINEIELSVIKKKINELNIIEMTNKKYINCEIKIYPNLLYILNNKYSICLDILFSEKIDNNYDIFIDENFLRRIIHHIKKNN